ncbi:MAG: Dabb family protein [Lachnospiraceae bacterium]|nr:Dabb family protein [Lachnospiraceae bacterium]
MVRHIILWQLKDECSDEKKAEVKAGIKEGLEGLVGKVPGLLKVNVHTEPLASSNADVMLESEFESAEALKGYAVHPDHVAVADGKVRPNVKTRIVMDFEA